MSNFFKVGDRVEFRNGGIGTIIYMVPEYLPFWDKTLVSLGLKSCPQSLIGDVEWDDWEMRGNPGNCGGWIKGKNISISVPMIDKSPEFNPVIRGLTTPKVEKEGK